MKTRSKSYTYDLHRVGRKSVSKIQSEVSDWKRRSYVTKNPKIQTLIVNQLKKSHSTADVKIDVNANVYSDSENEEPLAYWCV